MPPIKREKNLTTQSKLIISQEWEACLKMRLPPRKINNWRSSKHIIKILRTKREQENKHGGKINNKRTILKLKRPLRVISWLKMSKLPHLNTLATDLFHIILRVSEESKLMIFLIKELDKFKQIRFSDRMKTLSNINGLSKIYQTISNNWIMRSNLKPRNKHWEMSTELIKNRRPLQRRKDGQICTVT